jgi:hypothetical protein
LDDRIRGLVRCHGALELLRQRKEDEIICPGAIGAA